jgi:hypothetical protein
MAQLTELSALADQLAAEGYDAASLRELSDEMEALERPPGLITRMTKRARETAGRHWRNLVGELHESREAMALMLGRLVGGQLSAEERDKVRAQLVDLVKVFPAGLIAAANSAFPVPGTGMFTPWILARLGLMPSRWGEAQLLDQLQRQREKLLRDGRTEAAQRIADLQHRIAAEADARDAVADNAQLLTHWDANQNGEWDPEEIAAYRIEVVRVQQLVTRYATRKAWYIEDHGAIFGALRLSELSSDPDLGEHLCDHDLLVCYDGKSGWVALSDVLGSMAGA